MNQDKQSIYVFLFLFIIGFFLIIKRSTGPSSEITEEDIMDHIRYLSHPNREGRTPGSRGSKDVVSYLVKNFKSYGLKPGNGESFVQPFDIKTGIELGGEKWIEQTCLDLLCHAITVIADLDIDVVTRRQIGIRQQSPALTFCQRSGTGGELNLTRIFP